MTRPRRLALAGIALVCACKAREPSAAEAPTEAEAPPERGPLVTVELGLVDDAAREQLAARLGPDSPLAGADALIAVHHHIEPGWHIYWKNPGDSGLSTKIDAEARGAAIGEVLYPAPEQFVANGGQVMFGWADDAVLFVAVREREAGAQLELTSHFLACAQSCIPGDTSIEARLDELEVRGDPVTAAMLERVPQPAAGHVDASWADGALQLRPAEGVELDAFFPYATDTASLGRAIPEDRGLVLHYRFSGAPPDGAQGVLHAHAAGEERWFELDVPWPPT